MSKIVLMLNGFYPDYSTNGICVKKIIDLIKDDYEVHIIALRSDYHSTAYEYYDGIHIHRIETRETARRTWINIQLKESNNSRFRRRMLYTLNQFLRLYYWSKPFVQRYTLKYELISAYEKQLNELNGVDAVWGICFPMESIIAATNYKRINKSVKVGAILFDKFSTNVSHQKNSWNMKAKFDRHVELESENFHDLDYVLATTDWKNYIQKYHASLKNVHYIEIPALRDFCDIEESLQEYCYLGMVDRKIRPVTKPLKILKKVNATQVKFSFGVKGNLYREVEKFCVDDNFVFYGTLPVEESYEIQKKCKGLISIGNTDISQTPSKIFEYICTGKPIIHFYYDKEDRCIDILNRYGNAICVDVFQFCESDVRQIEEFINNSHIIDVAKIKDEFKSANPMFAAQLLLEMLRR